MKVAGIIAEYNPFHNGHQYQINELRRQTGADYVIIAMSGNFLQRGVPAILDKYERAQMALLGGADLVLELPAVWATASAEYFASAGVQLLGKTGVTDMICYGCEEVNPALMDTLVAALTDETDYFSELLHRFLKEGASYPAARTKALCEFSDSFSPRQISSFLSHANNILSLEYEKAIALWNISGQRPLSSHPILRIGEGYHSTELDAPYVSATAVRKAARQASDVDALGTLLAKKVPNDTLERLSHAKRVDLLLDADAFSASLYTRLWSYADSGYEQFADCNLELSGKIRKHLNDYMGFMQFAELLKTREVTHTRICRCLLHILLDIKQENYAAVGTEWHIPYLRLLGFRKEAAGLLSAIKREASVPLITKVADASYILSPTAFRLFTQDIRIADLYRTTACLQSNIQLPNEFTRGLLIL